MLRTTPLASLIFAVAAISIVGCTTTQVADAPTPDTLDTPAALETPAVITIDGMACPFCINNVQRQLQEVQGVLHAEIDLQKGQAVVTLSQKNPPTADVLRQAVLSSGFTPTQVQMP